MSSSVVHELARSEEADVREIAFNRILRQRELAEEDKRFLRDSIPSMSHDDLLELLSRHGDLGCTRMIIARLVEGMPPEPENQLRHVPYLARVLPEALGVDGYADFVERVLPKISRQYYFFWELTSRLRGCELFSAIAEHDADMGVWSRFTATKPMVVDWLDIRYDEREVCARLSARIAEASLRELLRLIHVLHAADLHDWVGKAWARSLDIFAFPVNKTPADIKSSEEENEEQARLHWAHEHWKMIVDWVKVNSSDRAARMGWLADRVAALERSGYPFGRWVGYGVDFPKELLHEVAGILLDRGEKPLWAAPVLRERLATGSLAVWDQVFAWWRPEESFLSFRFGECYDDCKAMLMGAPLPEDAPDTMDEAILCRAEALMAFERDQVQMICESFNHSRAEGEEALKYEDFCGGALFIHPLLARRVDRYRPLVTIPTIVDRLLQMRLTPSRAQRIARMIKGHRALLQDPRMLDVAAISGPIEPEALPALSEIDLRQEHQITLYRRLGGAVADEHLREYVRARFEEEKRASEGDRFMGSGGFWWWENWLPEIITGELLAEMTHWVSTLPLTQLLRAQHVVPWLVREGMLVEAAQRHLDAGLRWDFGAPASLRPFVEARAEKTDDDNELWSLLRWLEQHDVPRGRRLGFLLARLEKRALSHHLLSMLASMLATRSAWENEGAKVLRALLKRGDWAALSSLWYALMDARPSVPASKEPNTPEERNKMLAAVHLAFAKVIVQIAADAADAGDEQRLVTALTALLKLDPPPPIVRELAGLKRNRDLSSRVVERIDAGMKLFKSMEGREPSFDALFEATRLLYKSSAPSEALEPSAG